MTYDDWVKTVPSELKDDALWRVQVYRLALFLSDLSWYDATKLMRDKRTLELANQLYQAVGSISANIAEGYSRGSGKDRARFYEYGLGSARESRDWYYKSRYVLGETVVTHRYHLLAQIIRLLLTMIPEQRGRTLHEGTVSYQTTTEYFDSNSIVRETDLNTLLNTDFPLPDP